jgi:hypothetical protein
MLRNRNAEKQRRRSSITMSEKKFVTSAYPLTKPTEQSLREIEDRMPQAVKSTTCESWEPDDSVLEEKPKFDRAVRVHDFLYNTPHQRGEYTRLKADLLLYQSILEMTENRVVARMYYFGTRAFGKDYWKDQQLQLLNKPNIAVNCARQYHKLSDEQQIQIKSEIEKDGHLEHHLTQLQSTSTSSNGKNWWPYAVGVGFIALTAFIMASSYSHV